MPGSLELMAVVSSVDARRMSDTTVVYWRLGQQLQLQLQRSGWTEIAYNAFLHRSTAPAANEQNCPHRS